MYKIKFDKSRCAGCGACTICDNWELNADGIAEPKKIVLKEIGCNQDAADACPMGIIEIQEE